jgi:acid phosphatase type 7
MSRILLLITCLFLIAGCSTAPAVSISPTATREPTLPAPTVTFTPSVTPAPSVTATQTITPLPTDTPTPEPVVLSGAGDIGICGQDGDDDTAALLEKLPGDIFTAGDNSNENGTMKQFKKCFAWGSFLDRIHPAPGNHDYNTEGAQDYFLYFGAVAGIPGEGWYSYDYGDWHIVVLNSNCNDVACGKNSAQVKWLQEDLAAHPTRCTMAVWHHPRWSSGLTGSDGRMSPEYRALYAAGAELVISGHDHDYERFTPLNPEGTPDPQNGIRQFVVGTGGAYLRPFARILPVSEAHKSGIFGVLKLTLYPDRYDWRFIPIEGETYTDSGTELCH